MLSEKEKNNTHLSAVKSTEARIVKLEKPGTRKQNSQPEKEDLFPPLNQFNTSYIKAKENDPL